MVKMNNKRMTILFLWHFPSDVSIEKHDSPILCKLFLNTKQQKMQNRIHSKIIRFLTLWIQTRDQPISAPITLFLLGIRNIPEPLRIHLGIEQSPTLQIQAFLLLFCQALGIPSPSRLGYRGHVYHPPAKS